MSRNILIIGGNSKLAQLFAKNSNFSNYKLFYSSRSIKNLNYYKNNFFFLNLNNKNFINQLVKSNYIINFVGEALNETKMYNANVLFPQLLTNLIKKFNKKCKVLHISSISVYSFPQIKIKNDIIINEYSIPFPLSKYGRTKYLGEKFFLNYLNDKSSVLRPAQILGDKKLNNSINKIIFFLKKNFFFFIKNKNNNWSYVSIDDFFICIKKILHSNKNIRIINCVSNIKISLLINIIKKKYHIKSLEIVLPIFFAKFLLKINNNFFNSRLPLTKKVYQALTQNIIFKNNLFLSIIKKKTKFDEDLV
jgi:nucleoside-diphosphate-sugar epimerase